MGHGSYRASDWQKLKNSRGINSQSTATQLFHGNSLDDKYNPKFIDMRESRDSEDSPQSTPIIIGFDVTGSMGHLAAEIAKNSLNKTAIELYEKQPVTNPHIMCAAITAPVLEGALQVTQFEADIRIVEQLLDLKVGFGGNIYSFDSLVWYFAAKHTSIDSFEKRNKKGFLFVVGDEKCGGNNDILRLTDIRTVFGDTATAALNLSDVYALASEKYHIFHIVIDRDGSYPSWNEFMPGRCAFLKGSKINYLSEVITSIMQIVNGKSKDDVIAQWDKTTQPIIEQAISDINITSSKPDPEKPTGVKAWFSDLFNR